MRKGTQGDFNMIKFYSDKTHKYYSTVEEANKAEFELKEKENRDRILKEREEREKKERAEKLATERKTKAAEVEEARKAMIAAQHKYYEVLEAFTKRFGPFHLSLTGEDAKRAIPTLFEIFDLF